MTHSVLTDLRQSVRQLRGSYTSLARAAGSAAMPEVLALLRVKVLELTAEVEARFKAERQLLEAPHPFEPGLRRGRWTFCARCGGAEDRKELHPQGLQVTAAGGGRA